MDKSCENKEELERDIKSLYHEIPKYFSKPKLDKPRLPEVVKDKRNVMFVLRGIKSREDKQRAKSTMAVNEQPMSPTSGGAYKSQLERFLN